MQEKDDKAAAHFEEAITYLKENEFNDAFDAVRKAEAMAPENEEYAHLAYEMRYVKGLRAFVEDGMVPDKKWREVVDSLHAFYTTYQVHDELLSLDKSIHDRLNNVYSATLLTETLLNQEMNDEAFEIILNVDKEKFTLQLKILKAIALVRLGRKKEAVKLKSSIKLPKPPQRDLLFLATRLWAVMGYKKKALDCLARYIEMTPKHGIVCTHRRIVDCKDFAKLTRSKAFKKSLKTLLAKQNPVEDEKKARD